MPKLLLADDSVTIQRVIELTFADENIQVIAVGDGLQAITRIDAEPPDIVLADIGMPERDGYEVAAHVKGNPRTAHIPVLLLTGAFEPIDEARAHAVGCDGVLVKPFEPQMVINRVKDLLAGRRPASLWAPGGPPAPSGATSPAPVKPAEASPRPGSPAPARTETPAAEAPKSLESLDDYFDRLDAAFSTDPAQPAPALDAPITPPAEPESRGEFGTWDIPFESRQGRGASEPPREQPAAPAAAPARAPFDSAPPPANEIPTIAPEQSPAAQAPALADAFAALLAAEQKAAAPAAAPAAPSLLDEATIDEIARRVSARLTGDTVRSTVLDVAERLVREEIERIKQQAKL